MDLSNPTELENLLWLIVGIIIGLYVIIFLRKAHKGDLKKFNIGAASIFFALFFDSVRRLFLPKTEEMIFIGNIVIAVFCLPLLFYVEKNILKHKKNWIAYTSILLIGVFIVGVIISDFDRDTMNLLIIPPYAVEMLTILYVYISLVFKTTGIIRKSSALILVGLAITIVFWFLHGQFGPTGAYPDPALMDIFMYLSPIMILVGLSVAALGFFKYRPM